METDILSRIIKAIGRDDMHGLHKIATNIIEEEKKKGHSKKATNLESILKSAGESIAKKQLHRVDNFEFLTLPKNRRNDKPLLTVIPPENLRHHMVLSPATEERFQRIEKEFAARDRLIKYNLKPKKKILLYGPPGCGKTMGAERLAWNVGLPLLKVRFDSLISSYFGESAANLKEVFELSRKTPCVVLLDECDTIAKSRTRGNDVGEIPRLVNMLLMLLDEYDSQGLFIATSNLKEVLDDAIYRRFDDIIEIQKPSKVEIKKLLLMSLETLHISSNINWPHLLEQMNNFSSADVVTIAQNAAKSLVLEGGKELTQSNLEAAIREIKRK